MQTNNKVALVTGANKGIGLETARQLGQQGITVLIGARNAEKGLSAVETLRQEGIESHPLTIDVSNPDSIQRAAKEVADQFGKLDILVNNAGINIDNGQTTTETTRETFQKTLDTNLFGVMDTTNAFLPLLKKSAAGRIVNLSSILASLTHHADPTSDIYDFKIPAYNISKTALNAYTVHLAYELKDTNIKVNAAHPGWVKTEMGGEQAPMEIPDGAKTSVYLATLPEDGPNSGFFFNQDALPW